jgi:hypothetical protein
VRSSLPIQPTPLIGRERELAQVGVLLRQLDARLVTLTGRMGARGGTATTGRC